jgi:hypothetical protein
MDNNIEAQGLEGSARTGGVAVSKADKPFLGGAGFFSALMGWLSSNSQVEMT